MTQYLAGGGTMLYTTFGTWEGGVKVTRNYFVFTFDLFTLKY